MAFFPPRPPTFSLIAQHCKMVHFAHAKVGLRLSPNCCNSQWEPPMMLKMAFWGDHQVRLVCLVHAKAQIALKKTFWH